MNSIPNDDTRGLRQRQHELIESARVQAAVVQCGVSAPADSAAGVLAAGDSVPFAGPPSDSFTGYEILREIHRGGQGVVYQALQKSTRRKVAIKVMREGPFAGPSDLARFEREVQVLGALQHPNIVAIHDSSSSAGHFYFVMDYISGQPLDTYMAGARHSIRDTLALFATICEAVNAAHLRGIIHRDLKPSNIRIDEAGQPHILDFGLAKVATPLSPPLKGATQGGMAGMTMTGQFVGSLPWASPEQAEGSPVKIDVRTDVYSLGVVLYQMLTGKFPYDVIGPMRDVLDHIMNTEPIRPRSAGGGRLTRRIDDEVETIVLQCLAKPRERRYQTAGELARDVRHYLAGEAIEAKRDSLGYLLRKQLRQHRFPVAIVAGVLLLVTAGLVVSVTLWQRSERQRALAESNEQRAQSQAMQAKAVTSLLEEMLSSADPHMVKGRNFTVRQLLDESAVRIGGSLNEQPEVEASVRAVIGNAYRSLGEFRAAEVQLESALRIRREHADASQADVAQCLMDLAWLRHEEGDYTAAEAALREALAIYRNACGEEQARTAECLGKLAEVLRDLRQFDEAEASIESALATQRRLLGPEHLDIAESLSTRTLLWLDRGDPAAAEVAQREALAIYRAVHHGDQHPDVAHALNALAGVVKVNGRYEEALEVQRKALDLQRALLGDGHPDVAESLGLLAELLRELGRYAEAEAAARESLEIVRRVYGDDSLFAAGSLNGLGRCLLFQSKFAEAESYYREALAIRRKLGEKSDAVADTLSDLGLALREMGHYAEAADLHREALEILTSVLGDKHPFVAAALNNLATDVLESGNYPQAESLFRRSLELYRAIHGDEHPAIAIALHNLSETLKDQGKVEEAESAEREALATLRKVYGEEHTYVASSMCSLAALLRRRGEYVEAEALYRDSLAMQRRLFGDERAEVALATYNLAVFLIIKGDRDAAEPLLRESLGMFRRTMGDRHPRVGLASNELAKVLHERHEDAEAETLSRESLAIAREALPADHPNLAGMLESLGLLLVEVGKAAEAEPMLREALDIRRHRSAERSDLAGSLATLGAALLDLRRFGEAETLLRECVDIRLEVSTPTSWGLADARSMLGAALAGAGQFAEAEPLLLEGYDGMLASPKAKPLYKREALERIVKLYENWDAAQPGESYGARAADWRVKLEVADSAPKTP